MTAQCSHRNSRGTQCRSSALDGAETCRVHAAGYVAPKRAARTVAAVPAGTVPGVTGHARVVALAGLAHEATSAAISERAHGLAADLAEDACIAWVRSASAMLAWLLDDSTASAASLAPQPAGPAAEPVEAVDQNPRDAHEAPPAHESADDPRRHTGGPVVDVAGDSTPEALSAERPIPNREGAGSSPARRVDLADARLLSERGCEVWRCDWRRLAERARELGGVDALIVDAPYSEQTHDGHGTMARWGTSTPPGYDGSGRRELDYGHWTDVDVRAFMETWAPINRGWFVSLTDDELARAWKSEYRRASLTAFSTVACVISGMTVRMAGDGPSSWTIHCMVARPKSLLRWGTLVGAYTGPREPCPVVGGKPLWLMRALVRDYTRPGDLVCDPCMGGGTTALACVLEGRRFLGGDAMREHADIAVERLRLMPGETKRGQLALAAGGE